MCLFLLLTWVKLFLTALGLIFVFFRSRTPFRGSTSVAQIAANEEPSSEPLDLLLVKTRMVPNEPHRNAGNRTNSFADRASLEKLALASIQ